MSSEAFQPHTTHFETALEAYLSQPQDAANPDTLDRLRRLAESAIDRENSAVAAFWLGNFLMNGFYGSLPGNRQRGLTLLERAASQNFVSAHRFLGDLYSVDEEYQDLNRALGHYRAAAAQDDSFAACRAAELIYYSATDIEARKEAADTLQAMTDAGNPYALYLTARMVLSHMDNPTRKEEAFELIKRAHEVCTGDNDPVWLLPAIQGYMGNCLYYGIGVARDEETGLALLREAANGNDQEAANILSDIESGAAAPRPHPLLASASQEEEALGLVLDIQTYEATDPDEELDRMASWDDVRVEFDRIVSLATIQRRLGIPFGPLSPHFIVAGAPGTGKNKFITLLARRLAHLGVLDKAKVATVDLVDLLTAQNRAWRFPYPENGEPHPLSPEYFLARARGGILVLKDSRSIDFKDFPADLALEQSFAKQIHDFLSRAQNECLVVLYQEEDDESHEADRLLRKNMDLRRAFRLRVNFTPLKPEDILDVYRIKMERLGFPFEPAVAPRALDYIAREVKKGDLRYTNAHLADQMVFETLEKLVKNNVLDPAPLQDFPLTGPGLADEDVEAALAPLDELTGLGNVKETIRDMVLFLRAQQARAGQGGRTAILNLPHLVFVGAPGTGKTTVARLLGRILFKLGLLTKGHVVESDGTSLIGKYIGQTAPLIQDAVDKADGGVLFIDEAYTLGQNRNSGWHDSFREEAVSSLLKMMEDRRGRFIVIAAGYSHEMRNFLEANSGLKSRFSHIVEFENFSIGEMTSIYTAMAQHDGFSCAPDLTDKLSAYLRGLMTDSDITDFGNARGIRNLYEKTVANHSRRLAKARPEPLSPDWNTLLAEDLHFNAPPRIRVSDPEAIKALFSPLDKLAGMESVRREIQRLASLALIQREREKQGLNRIPVVLHSIFAGPPGTGKTTVARLFGRVLAELGYLQRGHVVEVAQTEMIGQFMGQTPHRVRDQVERAEGGILFLDEAYALGETPGGYGREALTALLKYMEDRRERFVVIAAGYKKEMDNFIEANPGLKSRFPNYIDFPAYGTESLTDILSAMFDQYGYRFSDEARTHVAATLKKYDPTALDRLGNARLMRNIFEKALALHADRIVRTGLGEKMDMTILPEDIEFPKDVTRNPLGFLG